MATLEFRFFSFRMASYKKIKNIGKSRSVGQIDFFMQHAVVKPGISRTMR